MRERERTAVRKASGERMLADMRAAARLLSVPTVTGTASGRWFDGYGTGLLAACTSATVRACLLTAWGA